MFRSLPRTRHTRAIFGSPGRKREPSHPRETMAGVPQPPGPAALGRGVIVEAGSAAPDGWTDAERVAVDDAGLADPRETVDRLHALWSSRTPVVVDLRVERAALSAPEHDQRHAYELAPSFDFARERLYFLVRANNYDARDGTPKWGAATEAQRYGARPGDAADVVLPDGTEAWCDGGPRTALLLPGQPVVHRFAIEAGGLRPDLDPAPNPDLERLAPDQRAAVLHAGGPARILAPAGSGKTTVLTARFRHLVVERGYDVANVCALAYNRRAGAEMQDRLADLPGGARHKVRTINSLGFEIVRRARPGVRVLDERDVRERIEPHVKLSFRANTDALRPYLEALEEVQLGLRSPAHVERQRGDVDGFAEMYGHYREQLEYDNAIDFDGQIAGAVEALCRDPALRGALQRECRHLLVDEFQDLRPAHLLLVRLLAAPAYDVFGVGDDDQVIYGYAGADPDFLINFTRYFPGAADHPLEVNYRCPPVVVDGARMLLAHNRRRVDKVMRAGRDAESARPDALVVERHAAEALAPHAADLLEEWFTAGVAPESIAVLARVNAGLLAVQVLAHDRGLPVTAAVGENFLRRTGVRSALAYLRIASAVADRNQLRGSDLAEVIRRPNRKITAKVVDSIRNKRWTIASLRSHAIRLDSGDTGRLVEFTDDLDALGKIITSGDAATVLRAVRDDIGLGAAMGTLDNSGRGRDASHLDDLTALIAIASVHPEPASFEQWLREHLQGVSVGDDPRAPGQVTLATVHRVKGLEWDRVIVLGAHDGLMPHRLTDDREEERRVFHVALTRCREQVVLVADAAAEAPFITELTTPPPVRVEGDDAPVEAWREKARRNAAGAPKPTESSPADEALRAWRLERSRNDAVPAYVVLHDSTIADIVAAQPRNQRELSRIAGIGPTKLERYGDDILRIISENA
jgi:DNA helicase-2/ATP-dependent DNA helicase PcrA